MDTPRATGTDPASLSPRPPRDRWLAAGCAVLLLTGVAHLGAHFAKQPPPTHPDGAQLQLLMESFRLEPTGRTTQELMNGFSLFFVASSWALAAVGLVIRRTSRRCGDAGRTSLFETSLTLAIACAAFMAVSLVYWFLPPTAFFGAACACFVISALRLR